MTTGDGATTLGNDGADRAAPLGASAADPNPPTPVEPHPLVDAAADAGRGDLVASRDGLTIDFGPPSTYERFVKWPLDRVIAAALLVLLAPLLLATAVAVLVGLGRPILFVQERVGRGAVPFRMYKFRTLKPVHPSTTAFAHVDPDDERHTTIGRMLRFSSLDELPQLWNVVRGEMSLIGPRPEITEIAVRHDLLDHPRHSVRPGITGRWQISEFRGIDYVHEHVDLDVIYVRELSFATDVRIASKTIPAVLRPIPSAIGRLVRSRFEPASRTSS